MRLRDQPHAEAVARDDPEAVVFDFVESSLGAPAAS
jgi:hypothetical protein